jgi:AmiR/NasT family two-component response regulator
MPVRMLIADDEPLVALALRAMVESQGYRVVGIADTGAAALDLTRSESPDVVLMDVRMPEMDGIEATRSLMERCPTCVIMVSGNGQTNMMERAQAAGAMDYVVKPVIANQVAPVVAKARRRFDRFMAIRRAAASLSEALETWLAVRRAVMILVDTQGMTEEDAFHWLERTATQRGRPLREVAQAIRPAANC